MLRIDDISKDLKVSRNTIVKLIKEGKLPAIKVGSQYRVSEKNFSDFTKASAVVEQPSIREVVSNIKN